MKLRQFEKGRSYPTTRQWDGQRSFLSPHINQGRATRGSQASLPAMLNENTRMATTKKKLNSIPQS